MRPEAKKEPEDAQKMVRYHSPANAEAREKGPDPRSSAGWRVCVTAGFGQGGGSKQRPRCCLLGANAEVVAVRLGGS